MDDYFLLRDRGWCFVSVLMYRLCRNALRNSIGLTKAYLDLHVVHGKFLLEINFAFLFFDILVPTLKMPSVALIDKQECIEIE